MPAPAITCLLVAAVLLSLLTVAGGVALAILCAVLEFILPTLAE